MSKPVVGILMGSDSDLPVMQEAADMLKEFGIEYEMTVASAHRTPKKVLEYSTSAERRGIKVIIAGAGGAAHLPGMVAAMTVLPVLGVPVESRALKGLDSLLSIVQMPGGVPVGAPVPAWLPTLSAMNSLFLIVPVIAIAVIGWKTVIGGTGPECKGGSFCMIKFGFVAFVLSAN
jgi:phosphoribosylaminoimidazole carboxylase PurE protein